MAFLDKSRVGNKASFWILSFQLCYGCRIQPGEMIKDLNLPNK